MLPIFGSANPLALTKNSSYRFHGFLLMRPVEDKDFVVEINEQYKKWHHETGREFVICTFLPPPKSWMERYVEGWISKYSDEDCTDDIAVLLDILKERNYKVDKDFFTDFISISDDLFNQSLVQQKNIANLFNLTENDLPAFVVHDNLSHNLAIIPAVNIFLISCIIGEIVEKKCLPTKYCIPLTLEDENILFKAISHSSKNFHQSFSEASYLLVARRVTEEKTKKNIAELIDKFPQFDELQNPEKFLWAKTLIKGLERHRSLVNSYIKQINLLESGTNRSSLDLKVISNPKISISEKVWRFRINEKYRALFFYKNDQRIHFYFGDHDYGIN